MNHHKAIFISTGLAHGLAWAASLGFAFLPAYQSTSGANPTLIEANGVGVLAILALPLLLTAVGPIAAREAGPGGKRLTLPVLAVALFLIVSAEYFFLFNSRGWFSAPGILALIAAAGFVAARRLDASAARATLGVAGMAMLLFCVGAIYSIGLFYVPSALALIAAAAMSPAIPSRRSGSRVVS